MANRLIMGVNWDPDKAATFFDEVAEYIDSNIAKKFKLGLKSYDCRFNATWASIIATFYISRNEETFTVSFRYEGIANLLKKEPNEYGVLDLNDISPLDYKKLLDWCIDYTWRMTIQSEGFLKIALGLIRDSWYHIKIRDLAKTCIDILKKGKNIDIEFAGLLTGDVDDTVVYTINGKYINVNLPYIEIAKAINPLSEPDLDLPWYDEIDLRNLSKEKEINLGKYIMQEIWNSAKDTI